MFTSSHFIFWEKECVTLLIWVFIFSCVSIRYILYITCTDVYTRKFGNCKMQIEFYCNFVLVHVRVVLLFWINNTSMSVLVKQVWLYKYWQTMSTFLFTRLLFVLLPCVIHTLGFLLVHFYTVHKLMILRAWDKLTTILICNTWND